MPTPDCHSLPLVQVGEPEELTSAGALAFYDKAADRVTPKNPAKLRKATARTRSSSASEDPIMRWVLVGGWAGGGWGVGGGGWVYAAATEGAATCAGTTALGCPPSPNTAPCAPPPRAGGWWRRAPPTSS